MHTKKIICLLALLLIVLLVVGPTAQINAASTPGVLLSPKNGELWRQTASYNIVWSGPPVVSIYLLKDGSPFREIYRGGAAPLTGLWQYVWKVGADVPLGSYQIRVQQLDNPAVSMTSPTFWVTAAQTEIAMTNLHDCRLNNIPCGAFKAGAPNPFKWRYSAIPVPSMRFVSFTMRDEKSGLTYPLATFVLNGKAPSNSPDGFGEATATIPASIPEIQRGTLITRAFAPGLPDVVKLDSFVDVVPAVEKPVYQGITLLSPTRGATLYQGTTNRITWKYDPNLSGTVSVKIINGATIASNIPIGSGGQGSYEWKIGFSNSQRENVDLIVSHDTMKPTVSDWTAFWVAPPKDPYIISSPAAGSFLEPGQKFQIKWQPKPGIAPSKTVHIYLRYGSDWYQPVNADGSGSVDTQLPLTLVGPTEISIYNTESAFCNSKVAFNVHPAPTIAITNPVPNSGTRWYKNEIRAITWNYTGYKPGMKADIRLKWAGGSQSRVIATGLVMPGTGGQGSYQWPIPADLEARTDYQIQVSYGGEGRGGVPGTREATSSSGIAIAAQVQRPPILKTLP